MTTAWAVALIFTVVTVVALAFALIVWDAKLMDARRELAETERELARWRALSAGIVLDRIGDAEDAIERAEWAERLR